MIGVSKGRFSFLFFSFHLFLRWGTKSSTYWYCPRRLIHSIVLFLVPADPVHLRGRLMVEQTEALFYEHNAQFLGSLKDRSVILAACRGGDVFCTRSACSEYVVDEWEL